MIGFIMLGTTVHFFSTPVHYNPRYFKKPNSFDHLRFINEDGKFYKDEHLLFFGSGKRKCVGEKLARAELFLFTSMLLQKFKFKKLSPDQVLDFDPVPGLSFHPKPFRVVVEERI